jgi:hypothetical protein
MQQMPMHSPDLTPDQPLAIAAVFPVLLCYYALAVLAILPNTFIFKFFLLPFILWQAWKCAVGNDMTAISADVAGSQSANGLRSANMFLVVRSFRE